MHPNHWYGGAVCQNNWGAEWKGTTAGGRTEEMAVLAPLLSKVRDAVPSEMLLIIRHIRIGTPLREQPAPHTCPLRI